MSTYDTWKTTEPDPDAEAEPRTLEQERDDWLEQREREQAAKVVLPSGLEVDADRNGAPSYSPYRWEFAHDDYDGAPEHSYGPPADHRCGYANTLADCVREIDELIEEGQWAM